MTCCVFELFSFYGILGLFGLIDRNICKWMVSLCELVKRVPVHMEGM